MDEVRAAGGLRAYSGLFPILSVLRRERLISTRPSAGGGEMATAAQDLRIFVLFVLPDLDQYEHTPREKI